MLIRSRAPLRLGLAGGGTDVSPFCDEHGGCVLNATINLYAHATLEPMTDGMVRFSAPDIGENIVLPAIYPLPTDGKLGLHCAVWNRIVRDYHDCKPLSLRLATHADAPPGSGLGTSSTLVVAIIKAFQEYLSLPLGEYEVAHLAFEVERLDMGLSGGRQDQYAATFGGFNFMEFYADDRVIVNPLRVKNWIISELEASLVLYFSGASRSSAKIIDDQTRNVSKGSGAALDAMFALKTEAIRMKEALLRGDFTGMTQALNDGWERKKQLSGSITKPAIDAVIIEARAAGAKAAKVSGAGGGGFIMFLTDPEQKVSVMNALKRHPGYMLNAGFCDHGTQGWKIKSNQR
jgi:D-glycero-alpha-D-manno-heptose-7-phosphate kinase